MVSSFLHLLPHREPFLFLDDVRVDATEQRVTATWAPRADWPIFSGHFPGNPVVPGVILIEVMAQAACILGGSLEPASQGLNVYLVGVDNARFRRQVGPGQRVDVDVRVRRRRRELWSFSGRASVEGAMAADADILATVEGGAGERGTARRAGRIHPTAIVHPDAELHPSVDVGPYAIIEAGVRLGPDCDIGAHAHVEGHTTLGARNKVFPYASVGSPPQDKKYHGEHVTLEAGDDNIFREFTTINPGTEAGGGRTTIGDRNLFMAYVHVAHDCCIGSDNVLSNAAQLAGHVVVEDHVVIGGMAGVHQFARVGRGAMIGGGSMLTLDLPPFCMAVGNRASLHGLNLVGLKRADMSGETVQALKESYRILFRQQKLFKEAIDEVDAAYGHDHAVQQLLAFIRASERGVVRPEPER